MMVTCWDVCEGGSWSVEMKVHYEAGKLIVDAVGVRVQPEPKRARQRTRTRPIGATLGGEVGP